MEFKNETTAWGNTVAHKYREACWQKIADRVNS